MNYHNIGSLKGFDTPEKFRQYLASLTVKDPIPEKDIISLFEKNVPGFQNQQISEEERSRRRNLSRKMQNSLTENLVSQRFPGDSVRAKKPSLKRHLITLFDRTGTREGEQKNIEIDQILRGSDPLAKGRVICEYLKPFQDMTSEQIRNLPDEYIADHFEEIRKASIVAMELPNYMGDKDLAFTDEQKKTMEEMYGKSQCLSELIGRSALISNPYYEICDVKQHMAFDAYGLREVAEKEFGDKKSVVLRDYLTTIGTIQVDLLRSRIDTIHKVLGARKIDPAQVICYNEEKQMLDPHYDLDAMGDELQRGKPVIGKTESGEIMVFQVPDPSRVDSFVQLDTEEFTHSVIADFNRKAAAEIGPMAELMKDAEYTFLRDSQQFKDMRSMMERVQKEYKAMSQNPTLSETEQFMQLFDGLAKAGQEYLDYKGKPDSDIAKKRCKTAQELVKFAKDKTSFLKKISALKDKEFSLERIKREQSKQTYEHTYLSEAEYTKQMNERNKLQKKANLNLVSDIIHQLRGRENNPYRNLKEMRTSKDPAQRRKKLHYGRGTMLTNQGKNVLKFSLAGSGFEHLRSEYKGKALKGSSASMRSLWKRFKNSVKSIFVEPKGITKKDLIEKKFGMGYRQVNEQGKRLKYARVKKQEKEFVDEAGNRQTAQKIGISLAGTQVLTGALDQGNYSMEKIREYVRYMGSQYLKPYLEDAIKNKISPEKLELPVVLKGHSRGAVSAVEGAMMLNKWISDNYPKYQDSVKFEIIQYDPVPGYFSDKGVHHEINHLGKETDLMKPLGANAETTVMYSLHSNHAHGFSPQIVKGAKRVIIAPFVHSVGLKGGDSSQKDGNHRFAYTDPETGEVYRSSALNELPEGVYMVDEMNNVIRMKDMNELQKVIDHVTANLSSGDRQESRYDAVKAAAESCFDRNRTLERENETENQTQTQRESQTEMQTKAAPRQMQ